jgi:hypothetical protein
MATVLVKFDLFLRPLLCTLPLLILIHGIGKRTERQQKGKCEGGEKELLHLFVKRRDRYSREREG